MTPDLYIMKDESVTHRIKTPDQVCASRESLVHSWPLCEPAFFSLHCAKITVLSPWCSLSSRLHSVLVGGSIILMHMWLTFYQTNCFPDASSCLHPIYCLSDIRIERSWPPTPQKDLQSCVETSMCVHIFTMVRLSIPPNSSMSPEEVNHRLDCSFLFCDLQLSPMCPPVLILIHLVLSSIPLDTLHSARVWELTVYLGISWNFLVSCSNCLPHSVYPSLCFSMDNWHALSLPLHPVTNMATQKDSQSSWNWPLSEVLVLLHPSAESHITVHPFFEIGFSVTLLLPEMFPRPPTVLGQPSWQACFPFSSVFLPT